MKSALHWAELLNFPPQACEAVRRISGKKTVSGCVRDKTDPETALLFFLEAWNAAEVEYRRRGIPRQILLDTAGDVRLWAENHFRQYGSWGISECDWLENHVFLRLFRLGRLQFQFDSLQLPFAGYAPGAPALAVHIPQGEPLSPSLCEASFAAAPPFFSRHFGYGFDCYTCHSWLLDPQLTDMLPPESNILKFQKRFCLLETQEDDSALGYIFGRGHTPKEIAGFTGKNSLEQAIIFHLARGGKLYSGYGAFSPR